MLYNVPVVLVGLYFFRYPALLANPGRIVAYYSVGVMAGAVVSLLVQFAELLKLGVRYQPLLDLFHPGVKLFGILVFPVLISQSVAYFNTFVTQYLASSLPGGELAASKLALRIMMIPLGLFATSIGVAIFPTMTEQVAQGRWDDFRQSISLGLRTTNFLTFPAAAGLVALGLPITRLFFQFGNVTPQDAALTSAALFWYSWDHRLLRRDHVDQGVLRRQGHRDAGTGHDRSGHPLCCLSKKQKPPARGHLFFTQAELCIFLRYSRNTLWIVYFLVFAQENHLRQTAKPCAMAGPRVQNLIEIVSHICYNFSMEWHIIYITKRA